MEGSWEGIAGCVVHVAVHGVYVVGGCNAVAREGMFLVGCCSWLQSTLSIPTERFIRTKLTFRLLFCSLHQSIHSSACYVCSDEDCRIAVETSAFF